MIIVPGQGDQQLQPVHIDDLTDLVFHLVEHIPNIPTKFYAVGPEILSLRKFLSRLRNAMGIRPTLVFKIPIRLVRIGAQVGGVFKLGLLTPETLSMLERGNYIPPKSEMAQSLWPRKGVEKFILPQERWQLAWRARLSWLLPVLRLSVATVWIGTGVVSLGIYPINESLKLLSSVGITGTIAPMILYASSLLDIVLGVGVFMTAKRRWIYIAQLATMISYMIILTWKLPASWIHPFGPLLKNIPLIAMTIFLLEAEEGVP